MRYSCLGYWPPKLTVTDEKWIVLWTFEWATNCFFDIIIIHFIWLIYDKRSVFGCLFVWIYRPTRDFSLIWRSQHCRWSAVNVDLCSAFLVIEQWGFLYATHLLWHEPTLFNCHLRGPVTHTPVAERLAVELSLPVFKTQVCRYRGSSPDIQHARRTLHLYATAAVNNSKYVTTPITMIFFFNLKKMVLALLFVCCTLNNDMI